ncbi:MAG TPA: SRPBCC family protein [Candidatus Angelobacter sp.]|nr:SRPBCC family protein [Candidatus Angelobacter sp.]
MHPHPILMSRVNVAAQTHAPCKLAHEQIVPRPLAEVFSFFSRAENLEALTPAWLKFRVLDVNPQPVQKGTIIQYKLQLRGLPLRWASEIVQWEPPHSFVDLQRSGPYKLWRHTHRFIAKGNSTRIIDEVLYDLPFGVLGRMAHWLIVRRDLEQIFQFREAKIRELFGAPPR